MKIKPLLITFLQATSLKALGAILALLFTASVSRNLSSTEAGLFFLALGIISFLSTISRFGFDNTIVKVVAINKLNVGELSKLLYSIYSFIIPVLLTSCFLTYLFTKFVMNYMFERNDLSITLAIMSPLIILLSLNNISAMILQGMERVMSSAFILTVCSNFVSLLFLLFIQNIKIDAIIMVLFVANSLTFIISLWLLRQNFLTYDFSREEILKILKISSSLFVVTICGQITLWSGHFFVGHYLTLSDVAMLAIAQRCSMFIAFFLNATNMVISPKIAKFFFQKKHDDLRRLVTNSVVLNCILTLPIFLFIILKPELLLSFFGADYTAAKTALIILVVGQLINALCGPVGFLLSMTGFEKKLKQSAMFSVLILVLLFISLIPFFGLNGAALAIALSITAKNLYCLIAVRKNVLI